EPRPRLCPASPSTRSWKGTCANGRAPRDAQAWTPQHHNEREALALPQLLDYLPMVEIPKLGSSAQHKKTPKQQLLSVCKRNAAPPPSDRGRSQGIHD